MKDENEIIPLLLTLSPNVFHSKRTCYHCVQMKSVPPRMVRMGTDKELSYRRETTAWASAHA